MSLHGRYRLRAQLLLRASHKTTASGSAHWAAAHPGSCRKSHLPSPPAQPLPPLSLTHQKRHTPVQQRAEVRQASRLAAAADAAAHKGRLGADLQDSQARQPRIQSAPCLGRRLQRYAPRPHQLQKQAAQEVPRAARSALGWPLTMQHRQVFLGCLRPVRSFRQHTQRPHWGRHRPVKMSKQHVRCHPMGAPMPSKVPRKHKMCQRSTESCQPRRFLRPHNQLRQYASAPASALLSQAAPAQHLQCSECLGKQASVLWHSLSP